MEPSIAPLGNDVNTKVDHWESLGSPSVMGHVDVNWLNNRLGLLFRPPTFRPTQSPTAAPSSVPSGSPSGAPTSVPTEATYLSDEFAMSSILFLCGLGVLQPIFGVILLNVWVW